MLSCSLPYSITTLLANRVDLIHMITDQPWGEHRGCGESCPPGAPVFVAEDPRIQRSPVCGCCHGPPWEVTARDVNDELSGMIVTILAGKYGDFCIE